MNLLHGKSFRKVRKSHELVYLKEFHKPFIGVDGVYVFFGLQNSYVEHHVGAETYKSITL